MNFKKIIFTTLFITLSLLVNSQNKGRFTLYLSSLGEYPPYSYDLVTCELSNTNAIYSVTKKELLNNEWIIDSVPAGFYTLKIIVEGKEFATIYQNIKIITNKNNYYDFGLDVERKKMYKEKIDTSVDTLDKGELTMNSLYGNNDWDRTPPTIKNEMLSGNLSVNIYHAISKPYSIGFNIGLQYSRTNFYNDSSFLLGKQTQYKHYASTTINAGLVNRFTFFNGKKNGADGLKLDIGLIYNFPLNFKQVIKVDDDTKIITRHIHTYTDFNAMVRLGYKYIGIQADYRLTSFLRQAYTETPQLKVGIVFYIPLPVNRQTHY